ncbi:Mediator of RNA polymerase II transcription subunit 5 [Rhizoctonia solani]|uniref:Mediator of RNA polymerase II transcription subunit 5 n=1 Tax=Rhizoctonia solani TaxID=456999 RepID=A0A0K6GAE4_9AGAM|nr:Mediator of RNA polymerase II transcription subunit 5 [Rhizoctonia solani]
MTDQAVDSTKPSPPPISPSSSAALSAALESATQCWQDELKILYSRAKSWHADVVWDAIDDDGQIEEVWGHKAIVWTRAPSSLQAMYSVPQIISGSSSISPAPDQLSQPPAVSSSTHLISYSNDRLLRIPLTINPTLLASGLESLYTGQEVPVGFSLATPLQDQQTKGSESTMEVGRYEKLRKDMINIWRPRMFSDVQITLVGSFASNNGEVAQAIFSSHRFILAARVPCLRTLLTKNLTPVGQNISSSNPLPLHLPTPPFTPPSLHFTLGFIYTGTMAFSHRNWDLDTAFGVVRAAIYLQIDTLANEARARIISEMMHGLFHAYLPFDEYERIIDGKWGTGGCKCKQCQRRAPRVLKFALGDDVRDKILERGAIRALGGMYGKGWATSEFLALPLPLKNTLLRGVKNRVSPRNIIPLLLATEAGLNKLFSNSNSPAEAVKDLMLQARKKIDEVLCNNLCDVLQEPEWIGLLESDAAGFGDMDKFDLVLASIRRGLANRNAGQIYQALVSFVLLREGSTPDSTLLSSHSPLRAKIEQLRLDVIVWIKKHWTSVRKSGSFDGLETWVLKEICDELDVLIEELVVTRPSHSNGAQAEREPVTTSSQSTLLVPSHSSPPMPPRNRENHPSIKSMRPKRPAPSVWGPLVPGASTTLPTPRTERLEQSVPPVNLVHAHSHSTTRIPNLEILTPPRRQRKLGMVSGDTARDPLRLGLVSPESPSNHLGQSESPILSIRTGASEVHNNCKASFIYGNHRNPPQRHTGRARAGRK